MDISVLDIGGNFAGPAIGLRALGHRVLYYRSEPSWLSRFRLAVAQPVFDADLVVVAGSFADEQRILTQGAEAPGKLFPDEPLAESPHPAQRAVRDLWLMPRLAATKELVFVDVSDSSDVDAELLRFGGTYLKRECALGDPLSKEVSPFPFLYHPILLELEWCDRLGGVLVPFEQRQQRNEILFAGMLSHERYANRREELFVRFATENPSVVTRSLHSSSLGQVWEQLQCARASLYLAGAGQLCFRLHELAALGVPAIMPEPWTIDVPDAWHDILPPTLAQLRSPSDMLRFYRDHYHPKRAAEWLLRVVTTPQGARHASVAPDETGCAPSQADTPQPSK